MELSYAEIMTILVDAETQQKYNLNILTEKLL